jgi:serine phosphatase RsbU (regulator of sigma subunit)
MRSLFHSRVPDSTPVVEPVPTTFPKIEGADIAAVFVGKRVAGDFYDSIRVSPERVLFGLLDVAGRRDQNRGLLTSAQEIFRTFGTELFSRPDINESEAMTELNLRLNRGLIEHSSGVHSCPAFIACYHEKFGTLCYTNAGHTPGLLRDGAGITELPSTGLPLGLFSHATSDAPTVGLAKGASLLLVSRGVVSCEGNHHSDNRSDGCADDEFGLDRVKQLLQSAPSAGAQALCTSILQAAGAFSGEGPPHDDRTALALVRTA